MDIEVVGDEVPFVASTDGTHLLQGFGQGGFHLIESVEFLGEVACNGVGDVCIRVFGCVTCGLGVFGFSIIRLFAEPFEVIVVPRQTVNMGQRLLLPALDVCAGLALFGGKVGADPEGGAFG